METPAAVDSDAIFEYDEAAQTLIQQQKPWVRDPNYFKNVKISALALLKVCVSRPPATPFYFYSFGLSFIIDCRKPNYTLFLEHSGNRALNGHF